MICSFGDAATADLLEIPLTAKVRKFHPDLILAARESLDMLHAARRIEDLMIPPGDRLEALRGDLVGYHSIRVTRQWRLVFRWTPRGPAEVTLMDYH